MKITIKNRRNNVIIVTDSDYNEKLHKQRLEQLIKGEELTEE